MLGFNYPGDPWYGDAHRLLTSKGLKPAVEPKSGGGRLFRIPFTKDKNKTVAPPQAAEPNAAVASSKNTEKRSIFRMPFGKQDKGVLPDAEAEAK